MRFSHTRRALRAVRSVKLRQDIEDVVGFIERAAKNDPETAGRSTTQLFGFVFALRRSISHKTRFSVVNAIFDDAIKASVPHQWERKEGFECGPNNDCTKPNASTTCYRDTSGHICYTN